MSDQAKITLTGILLNVFPTEQVSEKFKKRVIWLQETTDQYPQTFSIEFTQDQCGLPERFQPGDEVEVSVNLRGRQHTKGDKDYVFNSLQAWRISLKQPAAVVAARNAEQPVAQSAYQPTTSSDDLPF